MKTLVSIFLSCFFAICFMYPQANNNLKDSEYLKNASYKEIFTLMAEVHEDTLLTKEYIDIYYNKALSENNTTEQGRAIAWYSIYIPEEKMKLQFLDSAIVLTKNSEDHLARFLPYSYKGLHFLNKCDYKNALDSYFIALKIAKEAKNIGFEYITKHNIGVIKGEIGRNKEALELFQELIQYQKSKEIVNTSSYVTSLLYISEYMIKEKKLDSAAVFIEEGLVKSNKVFKQLYCQLLLQKGILYLKKGNAQQSESLLQNCLQCIDPNYPQHKRTLVLVFYYLGIAKNSLGKKDIALKQFIKMDSVIQAKKYITNEVREGYHELINHFKRQNDPKNQLLFVNRLLKFDSINFANGIEVNKRLYAGFDTPTLLEDKNQLIKTLKKSKTNYSHLAILLGVFVILILVLLYKNNQRHKRLKNKVNELLKITEENTVTHEVTLAQEGGIKDELGIPQNLIEALIDQISQFEKNKGFLNKEITLRSLSLEFNTNTSYLSTIINKIKGKNFSTYLKELRIEHAIQELKTNKKLRTQLTIEGIASEFGFSSSESFSLAFKKETGLRPSYFIKELNKLD